METPVVVKSRGRPRKRRREDDQIEENCNDNVECSDCDDKKDDDSSNVRSVGSLRKRGRPPKRRAVDVRGEAAVGRYVLKEFEENGVFLGKIVSYDSGLYRVDYEDGDFEDLDNGELRDVLIDDERKTFVGDLLERKKNLDEIVAEKSGVKLESDIGKVVDEESEKGNVTELIGNVDIKQDSGGFHDVLKKVEVPTLGEGAEEEVGASEVDDGSDDDVSDSSSDSCEYGQGWDTRSEIEIPAVPPPELPPYSGNIGVPEEYVSHLFSVYGFLRSFSICLFLSPFSLDDLVGCLNCNVPNTLLDAIHVALLRALRQHLESQASNGSELASKCLRCIDWAFLDILTWPMYLIHYLMVMGHLNSIEWKGFYIDVLQKDYCTLSIGLKLTVLQILCDDALDTAEIRTEIDNRVGSEVGVDFDGITPNPLDNGPEIVYPRSTKTSVAMDRENVNPEAHKIISVGSNVLTMKGNDPNPKFQDIDENENGDECRLCGMDGMLLCCDGCPSAYHSRCIGVNKLSLSGGKWFCPDCKISRGDPAITTETSLRGAVVLGVDPYAQLFLATCNHLLVLKVSMKPSPFVRYYNCNDIPKVVTALCSSSHHAISYLGLCQAILKYWELPQVWLPILRSSQISMDLEKKDSGFVVPITENGNQVLHKSELEDYGYAVGESVSNHVSVIITEKCSTPYFDDASVVGGPMQNDLTVPRTNDTIMNDFPNIMSSSNADLSCLSVIEKDDGSNVTGISSCTFGNKSGSAEQNNGFCLVGNFYMHQKEESNEACGRAAQHPRDTCLYMGSKFKPNTYINHYVHGDFAACAAANFAELSSDEKRSSELHASDPRKVMSANVILQTKAFASPAARFFWPSSEKKLVEIPRERCSWCFHCKAPATSKKACLLNQAALNATRAPMKFFSGLKFVKNVEAGLYGIAAYTLYIEESLRGLIVGPFQSASYQKQWHKKVEQASSCSEMKSLLLELEENLCTIALSSEWTRLVENWTDESSVPQSACATEKRGTGRRKKHLSASDIIADESDDSLSDLNWRSGKLSKLVFQRGTLPCSVLRKAARQGGSRKISGIHYAEGSDVPKRSRQFIWRASVEMSTNASGLALQVRYLDYHIKWSDLLRPEQSVQDGKSLESEAHVFRSAQICDKKLVDSKIMYGVVFKHQKHMSSRLMKSIIEKEETLDGKDKFWFLETRIPLYLIKEYEEHLEKTYLSASMKSEQKPDQKSDEKPDQKSDEKPDQKLSKHQKRQLKAFRKRSFFLYLNCKRDGMQMCYCASCQGDVYTGVSATCSACEGYCHKGCVMTTTVLTNDDAAFVTICKKCSSGKALIQNNSTAESPTSPLALEGQDFQNCANVKSARLKATSQQCQNSVKAPKGSKAKSKGKAMASVGTSKSHSDKKPAASSDSNFTKKKRQSHWGLIWKKTYTDDGGFEFRSKNILFRRTLHGVNSFTPECQLCQKPYNPHLMYIRCEICQYWHHADAVELDESKLSKLMGYKCCRCRRMKTPVCPYADKNTQKPEVKIRIIGPKKVTILATGSVSEAAMLEQAESLPSTPMSLMEDDVFIEVDDSLLLSVSNVEENPEPKVGSEWNAPYALGPQKLPVRRQIMNERDDDGVIWIDDSAVQLPASLDANDIDSSHLEWDVSNGGFEDGTTLQYEGFNYDNIDYEPQTYFSFTELLDPDDVNNQFGGVDVCGDGWENLPCEYSHSGFPEHFDMESFDDFMPSTSMDGIMGATCNICSQTTPVPDLACQTCGLQIHRQCSPGEEVSLGVSWKCGSCREWS